MSNLDKMLEQVKRIKGGTGVQSILDAAYSIIGNPVAVFDTEYKLVAYSDAKTDDPLWNELIQTGTFCESTRRMFEAEGFVEEAVNALQSVLLTSKNLKYDMFLGKVFNKNNYYVANLVLFGCKRSPEECDRIIFDVMCRLLTREISKQDYYLQYEQEHQGRTIQSLIDGSFDIRLDLARVSILYEGLGPRLYVAVVDVSHNSDVLYNRGVSQNIDVSYNTNVSQNTDTLHNTGAVYNTGKSQSNDTLDNTNVSPNIDVLYNTNVSPNTDTLHNTGVSQTLDTSQNNADAGSAVYCRDYLKKLKPAYRYAVHDGRVVVLISTEGVLDVGKELGSFVRFLEQNNLYAGLSKGFENLFHLRRHYDEAVKSLECAIGCRCKQRIFPFDTGSLEAVRQIERLRHGGGIQYLLDEGAKILGNPLLFHDMELNLLGISRTTDIIDPIWQELVTYGTSSTETIELFKTEGIIATMDSIKTGAFLISDKIKYDRISWRIYNGEQVRIGCTSIVNTHKHFCEDELVLFGLFSNLFCGEVEKIEKYNDYGRVYSDTIINRLICGKINNNTFYSQDAGNLYNNLMDNMFIVVADTSGAGETVNIPRLRRLFNLPGTVNRYAIYSNYIVIIISADSPHLCQTAGFSEVRRFFEKHNIYAGVSCRFDSIYDVQKYYRLAVLALSEGRMCGEECHVFEYKE